jgi:hypothetical protein
VDEEEPEPGTQMLHLDTQAVPLEFSESTSEEDDDDDDEEVEEEGPSFEQEVCMFSPHFSFWLNIHC